MRLHANTRQTVPLESALIIAHSRGAMGAGKKWIPALFCSDYLSVAKSSVGIQPLRLWLPCGLWIIAAPVYFRAVPVVDRIYIVPCTQ